MKNLTIPVAAVLLIVAAGFQHRQQIRSEAQNDVLLEKAAQALDELIPRQIGEWTGVERPIESRELQAAEIVGCVSRNYAHRLTGESAQVVMMCGPPGPISVHTPDVCFAGIGYEMITEPKRILLELADGQTAEFWWADFRRGTAGYDPFLRTFWSWRAQGPWKVVDHPRLEFAGSPLLYKLYVATPVIAQDIASIDQPDAEFLKALLLEFERAESDRSGRTPVGAEH